VAIVEKQQSSKHSTNLSDVHNVTTEQND